MKMTDVITGLRAIRPELKKSLDETIDSFKALKNLSSDLSNVRSNESRDAICEKLELAVLRSKEAVTDLGILVEKVCQVSDLYTRELAAETKETKEEKKDEDPYLPGMSPEASDMAPQGESVSVIMPTAEVAE